MVGVRELKIIPVPLPPLNEQHRIIEKMNELMAICDSLENGLLSQHIIRPNLMDSLILEALEAS